MLCVSDVSLSTFVWLVGLDACRNMGVTDCASNQMSLTDCSVLVVFKVSADRQWVSVIMVVLVGFCLSKHLRDREETKLVREDWRFHTPD
jgi:hypothetical protein